MTDERKKLENFASVTHPPPPSRYVNSPAFKIMEVKGREKKHKIY